jgi:hypothetical protein
MDSSKEDNVNRAKMLLSGTAEGVTIDLTSEESIKSCFGRIGEFDHLVYTAGESLLTEPLETLRVCPETSRGIAKFSEHEAD